MEELNRLARATLLPAFDGHRAPDWLLRELDDGLAGVTLFAINGNVPDTGRLAALTGWLRGHTDAVVAIDEEGGDVTRLAHDTGSPYPGNAALGAVDRVELTRRVYRSLGADLREVGVTLDLAPAVDVNTAADNPIIGTRSFGTDPELVARHAVAAVDGLQSAGVAACVKHFPGHGATSVDSHQDLPVIDADLDLLARRELVPFRAAIEAGTHAVMTGHLTIPALTGAEPATLSHRAITGLLRDGLGYQGVIVTDALDMRGASGVIGIPEAAVRALIAGADLLCLGPREQEASVARVLAAITGAVRAGRLSADRLAEATERVAKLRAWCGTPATVHSDRSIGLEAGRLAVLSSGDNGFPLRAPLVVELDSPPTIAAGPVPWGLAPWVHDLRRVDPAHASADQVLAGVDGRQLVVVVRDAHRHPDQRALAAELLQARPDAVLVELGLPVWRPEGHRYLASYGATYANCRAVAERLGLTA